MTANAEFGPSGPGDPDTSIVLDEHLGWRPWCSGRMNAAPRRAVRAHAAARPCVDAIIGRYLEALGPAPTSKATGAGAGAEPRGPDAETARTTEMTGPCSPLPIAIRRRQASGRRPAGGDEMQRLELAFVEHAPAYGQAKGISYETWRRAGVPVRVLRLAGIRP